jgi:hypothetical protein
MSSVWVTGFCTNSSVETVARSIVHTVESTTAGILKQVEDLGRLRIHTLSLACVSPEENGWIAFWHEYYWFTLQTFRLNHLSGLMMSVLEESVKSSWDYIIWEDGKITEWFVSNPLFFFYENDALEFLEPFIKEYIGNTCSTEALNDLTIKDILSLPGIFEDTNNTILRFARQGIEAADINDWKKLGAVDAHLKAPELFAIPYVGLAYRMNDLKLAVDIERGKVDLRSANNPIFRDAEWMSRVKSFTKLYFSTDKYGIDYQALGDHFLSQL